MTDPTQPETVLTMEKFEEALNLHQTRFSFYAMSIVKIHEALLAHDAALRQRVEALEASLAGQTERAHIILRHFHEACAEKHALTTQLAAVTTDLETQRTATYQAVEREHAVKRQLQAVEAKHERLQKFVDSGQLMKNYRIVELALKRLAELGGGRSEGNWIAKDALAALQGKGEGHE